MRLLIQRVIDTGACRVGLALIIVLIAGGFRFVATGRQRPKFGGLRMAPVHRAELDVSVTVAGRIKCSKNIEVRCELRKLDVGGSASRSRGGSSTIISLIPDGTVVRRGEVLCELDASQYVELVQQQTIKVEQARAEKIRAEYDLESAQTAAHEYRYGVSRMVEQGHRGQVALARSERQRADDRLDWTSRMLDKGYASVSQVASDRTVLLKAGIALDRAEATLRNYLRFVAPREQHAFESRVHSAKANLNSQTVRLTLEENRLAYYQEQLDHCTIRAPQDGLVIYAHEPEEGRLVEFDASVRERQILFYLPDLSHMEVVAILPETVVDRVGVGMPVRVKAEAYPDRPMEGRVSVVSQLPLFERESRTGNEVKNYPARVQLEAPLPGIRPNMTAELKIATGTIQGALVIPRTAATNLRGRDAECYVARGERLVRCPVRLGQATRDLIEVVEGLTEGDVVVLNPPNEWRS